LRGTLVPLLDQHLDPSIDLRTFNRYQQMKERYQLHFSGRPDPEP
jgi:hypothetical protein